MTQFNEHRPSSPWDRRIWSWCGRRAGYLIPAVLSALAVQTWFRLGAFVATNDVGPFLRNDNGGDWRSVWNHQTTGAGSPGYRIVRWAEMLVSWVVERLGGNAPMAQRLWYTLVVVGAVLSVAWLAAAFVRARTAYGIAGLIAVFNGFYLTYLPNLLPLIETIVIALTVGIAVRLVRDVPTVRGALSRPRPWWIGLAVLPLASAATNPPVVVVSLGALCATALVTIVVAKDRRRSVLRFFLMAAGWVLALNAFWVVPMVWTFANSDAGTVVTAVTDPEAWAWVQRRNSLGAVATLTSSWAWGNTTYFPATANSSWWYPLAKWCLPIGAIVGLLVTKKRAVAIFLVALGAVFIFVSKGLHSPFADVNLLAYKAIPGFWLLRQPQAKIGPLLIGVYALGVALGIDWFVFRYRAFRKWVRGGVGLVVTLLSLGAVSFAFPLITGTVIPTQRVLLGDVHVEVPHSLSRVADFLNRQPGSAKVLQLPLGDFYQLHTDWGYYGVDSILASSTRRAVIQRQPGAYYADRPAFAAARDRVEGALTSGDVLDVPPLLRSLGVGYVVIRGDVLAGPQPGRALADSHELVAALERTPGMRRVFRSGKLSVFSLGGGQISPILVSDHLTRTDASLPSSIADVVAATGGAVVSDLTPGAAINATLLTPTTTGQQFNAEAGTYNVRTHDSAPVLYTPQVGPGVIKLTDPGRIAVNGNLVTARPSLFVPASATPIALDVNGRGQLIDGPVAVTPDTRITALAAAGQGYGFESNPVLGNCFNRKGVPKDQFVLRSSLAPPSLTLEANQDSACVSTSLGPARDGWWRVLGQAVTITGSSPRLCVYATLRRECLPMGDGFVGGLPNDPVTLATLVRSKTSDGPLRIYLYADTFQGPTVIQYGGVSATPLRPVGHTRLWPTTAPTSSLALPGGTTTVTRSPPTSQPLLDAPSPVRDCRKTDSKSMEAAGLYLYNQSSILGLGATYHSACTAIPVHLPASDGAILIRVTARALTGRAPRACLLPRAGDPTCVSLGVFPADGKWHTVAKEFILHQQAGLGPDAAIGDLILYADGAGKPATHVQYTRIRAQALPAGSLSVAKVGGSVPGDSAGSAGRNTYTTPAKVAAGSIISLAESDAPGWSAQGRGVSLSHQRVNGWANGWIVSSKTPGTHEMVISIRYRPEILGPISILLSLITALGLVAFVLLRRHRRSHGPEEATTA